VRISNIAAEKAADDDIYDSTLVVLIERIAQMRTENRQDSSAALAAAQCVTATGAELRPVHMSTNLSAIASGTKHTGNTAAASCESDTPDAVNYDELVSVD